MSRTCRTHGGYSLLEMTVAMLIFSAISVALAATLAAGLKVWQRASAQDHALPAALIGCESLDRDVSNALRFYGVPFKGGPDHVSFPVLLNADVSGATWTPAIGTVAYRFDTSSGSIMRKAWRFPLEEPGSQAEESIMMGLAEAAFSYLVASPGEVAHYQWRSDAGTEPAGPLAVRITAATAKVDDHDGTAFTKTMHLHR